MIDRADLERRIERQRQFFAGDRPGDRLLFVRPSDPPPEQPPVTGLMERVNQFIWAHDGRLPEGRDLERIVAGVVSQFRTYWAWRAKEIPDDDIPIIAVHFDIGIQTAVMTGLEPRFLDTSWWLDASLDWDAIDRLTFDPENRWYGLFIGLNRLLWKHWEEDYFFLPFWHRSPLDAANGIRGNELFLELHTDPERVKGLTAWCVETQLEIERGLYAAVEGSEDWGIGHMHHLMPKRAVWVNGDPVTVISREMMLEFEQPATGRLFTATGGGYFHNHTKGIYQVDQVARTPGILLQHFNADPNCPRAADVLAGDPDGREQMLAASRRTPIYVDGVNYDELATFRDALPEGRFSFDVACPTDRIPEVLNEFLLVPRRPSVQFQAPKIAGTGTARPEWTRANSTMDLRGEWAFSLRDPSLDDSILLPGTTDLRCKGEPNPRKETRCLTPAYPYVGEAWYAREVTIPDEWVGELITLFIERTKSSKAWLDDTELGEISERLSTPHVYELPADTSPGRHRLTVMIDNQPRLVRDVSHALSESTQGNWNGMIGRLELHATVRVFIDRVKVTPNVEQRRAGVDVTVRNVSEQDWSGVIQLRAEAFNTGQAHAVPPLTVDVTVAAGATEVMALSLEMGDRLLLWDEFSPALYRLEAALKYGEEVIDTQIREFGMRSFSRKGLQLTINGRPTFLRGKHDACVFPETGHPPMDVAGWLRVMGIARDYGINHYRFHSHCPPEAAFAAADRLGIYLQPELSNGSLMKEEPEYGAALREEAEQILSCYADHASFVMFALGNELKSKSDNLERLARDVRAMDDRPLHAWGSNNFFKEPREHPGDDFWVTFRTRRDAGGNCRASYAHPDPPPGHIETGPPGTRHDYTASLSGVTMPVVGHETGQFQVYPNFPKEVPTFKGPMRPHSLQTFWDRAVEQGATEQDIEAMHAASGALAVLCYREDVEAALRTPNFGGFQLLDLQDYPGQGTAMVGVVDSFMESKGLVTPEAWRRFCCETVPLARFDSYTWTREQRFEADLQVAHYGPAPLENATLSWQVTDRNGAVICSGITEPKTVVCGSVADLGRIEIELAALAAPAKYTLCLVLDGTAYRNDYPLWVYNDDDGADPADRSGLSVADRLNADALAVLERGGTVLLAPDRDELVDSVGGLFQCDFWCFPMFKVGSERRGLPISPGTLGIVCDPAHPLFAAFPTESHSNWQWWHIVKNARPMVMDALPQDVEPVIAATDNIQRAHRLGLLVEATVGRGKLLICSVDREAIVRDPAGRQFWRALCEYAGSDGFDPQQVLEPSQLALLVRMRGQK